MPGAFPIPIGSNPTAMITSAQYTLLTGKTPPANFSLLLPYVQTRLELVLGRKFSAVERTETLRYYRDGYVYPAAYPVRDAGEYTYEGNAIFVGGNLIGGGLLEVTYTGGYTAFAVEPYATACPVDLAQAIAFGIETVTATAAGDSAPVIPSGVTSLSIAGEWSISKDKATVIGADGMPLPASLASLADLGGRCATLAARYRRIA